jgi:hypothetical protein
VSVNGCEIEETDFDLRVVSVFSILECGVDGYAIAAWSLMDGGVRHYSSDVTGDD